jgi:hypothetical protein
MGLSASIGGSVSVAGMSASGSASIGIPTGPNMGGNLARATILLVGGSGGGPIPCMFNPSEYSLSRSSNWTTTRPGGSGQTESSQGKLNVPPLFFTGISDTKMSLELFFDSTLTSGADVRSLTDGLWKTVTVENPGPAGQDPPQIIFQWGKHKSNQFAVMSLSQKFLLFNEAGDCLRSTVTLELKQGLDPKMPLGTNPTSYGKSGKLHTIVEGDRLDLIAAKAYNKPGLWRHIAEYNGINNPRDLVPGRKLVIPPMP